MTHRWFEGTVVLATYLLALGLGSACGVQGAITPRTDGNDAGEDSAPGEKPDVGDADTGSGNEADADGVNDDATSTGTVDSGNVPEGSGSDGGGDAGGLADSGALVDASGADAIAVSDARGDVDEEEAGDAGKDATTCGTSQASCNGNCIDVSQDDNNCGSCGHTCSGATHCGLGTCQPSPIQHVVLIVQENHTFETYFGQYCQAVAGSNPSCTNGPSCCEGAPSVDPSGATPYALDDDPNNPASNFATDRDHDRTCELQQIDNGKMDQYVIGGDAGAACSGNPCATNLNWVLADGASATSTVALYWTLAGASALADRYFQPIAGGTASNNMYFAGARYRFVDNGAIPAFAPGETTSLTGAPELCTDQFDPKNCLAASQTMYADPDIASLMLSAGKTFAAYGDGYSEASAAAPSCPSRTAMTECPYNDCIVHPVACQGCIFDPSDIPFTFFSNFNASGSTYFSAIKDYGSLKQDLAANQLPNFSFVKARLYHNEHPNFSTISDGIAFVQSTIQMIQQSPAASSTLILLTWDEGGGFFDHVPPPASLPTSVDQDNSGAQVPYGTRVPLLAIGPFAAVGKVSHVQMEHSSIVKFLEYNFLGSVGQLGARDLAVNNIGSMLDPGATVITVPAQ